MSAPAGWVQCGTCDGTGWDGLVIGGNNIDHGQPCPDCSGRRVAADLQSLLARLSDGAFYSDYDEDWRLVGVLREHLEALVAADRWRRQQDGT